MGYVAHRLAVAGASARVEFDEAALAALHTATRGVPRLVNLVCDRALARGRDASASVIDEAMIMSAAGDLDLTASSSDNRVVRMATVAVVLLLSVLAGAGAAAWVFREEISRLVVQWRSVPTAPAAPIPDVVQPATPGPPAP
jgi:general secretion pathway protein A